jgi:hypothetical protein
MSYKNATITKKANVYFDGQVTSRSIVTIEGEKKTLGIMMPGSYSFNTGVAEIMEMIQGSCNVRLAGIDDWHSYHAGDSFNVPANSSFDIEVVELMDYVCHFE